MLTLNFGSKISLLPINSFQYLSVHLSKGTKMVISFCSRVHVLMQALQSCKYVFFLSADMNAAASHEMEGVSMPVSGHVFFLGK